MLNRLLPLLFVAFLSTAAIAQSAQCPTRERAAVTEAQTLCSFLADGTACLGNSPASADLLADADFVIPGDQVSLTDTAQLATAITDDGYGIAMLQTTGYAPNSWQSASVTLALLGDITLSNTGNENVNVPTADATVVAPDGVNVRAGASTEYVILTSLFDETPIKLTGIFRDGSFYRLQLPDGRAGWIASDAVSVEPEATENLPLLSVDDPAPEILYAPYTSFSLLTASDDAPCTQAWQSGVLVQSNTEVTDLDEALFVRLRVNDIDLRFFGTLFLQADDSSVRVHVLDGQATYTTVSDNLERVNPGYRLTVTDTSISNVPYNFDMLAPLPTEILPVYTYIGIELTTIITPAPDEDRSPIADVLVEDPCVITTGEGGANLRAGPGSEFAVRGVLDFRETALPIGRAQSSNGTLWWELAQNVWISSQVVVTGGDCVSVPTSERIPVPLPTATPES
ncbi:MAG: SH3 domain-containing protein [Chloroflexota bacterium]